MAPAVPPSCTRELMMQGVLCLPCVCVCADCNTSWWDKVLGNVTLDFDKMRNNGKEYLGMVHCT